MSEINDIFTVDEMRASLADLGVVGTLENEIAYYASANDVTSETRELLQASLDLINQMGVALQTCYRVNPVFKDPVNDAETHMVGLVRDAIRAHMPTFLDPYNAPDGK